MTTTISQIYELEKCLEPANYSQIPNEKEFEIIVD